MKHINSNSLISNVLFIHVYVYLNVVNLEYSNYTKLLNFLISRVL